MKTYRTSDSVYLSSKVSAAVFRMTLSTKPAFRPSFRFVRFSAFIVSVAIIAAASYSASSASSSLFASGGSLPKSTSTSNPGGMLGVANGSINATTAYSLITEMGGGAKFGLSATGLYPALALQAPPGPESIATFAADCVTPKTDFNLGEVVCAKATGVPVTVFSWHVAWVDTAGFIVQSDTASPDDTTHYLYTLPSTPTSVVNGQTVDNAGTWRVNLTRFSGAIRQTVSFTVHEPGNATADVFVQKFSRGGDEPVATGGSIPFLLVVGNNGPDTAQNVHLVDSLPSGATLLSFTQQSGPACTPAGNNDCTMASLARGERAEFTAVYTVGGSAGTFVTSASVSSATPDPDNSNNSSSAQFEITAVGGTPTCSLTCPTSPAAVNNEPGQNGAHVTFSPPVTSGTCGAVSTTATSGAFFPIGISTITASTESGETCTFAVTVKDVENPTISCPENITTFENPAGSGSATVSYTVTANDNSGSATVTCVPPSGSSFNVGPATTVTCHATDVGLNISADCIFPVTVNSISAGCTLTPPEPIVVNSPANACGTIVTFAVTPSATGCGTVTCNPPSGSFFPGGATLVTCTSSPDGASTSFTVTVNDVTAPVPDLTSLPTITRDCTATAGIPTPTVIQTPTGPVTIIVMEPPTATDNCGGRIAGATEDPRTYQDPGTFIVHWTYTDASGNTSTQNQTIVVTGDDTSPPTITAPGPVTFNTGPTSTSCDVTIADLDVSLGEAIANDSCSVATVERLGVPAGNVFPVGPTLLTYTATDAAGHQASATQLVTVVDNTLPVLTAAPGPVTLYTGAGATSCGVTVTDLDATLGTGTAHDNCAFTITRLGLPAGNVFPVGLTTITYRAVDASGNQSATTATQDVTVVDNTPPTITLSGANPQYVECHTSYPELGATAIDNCGNFAATATGSVNPDVVGTYTITYNATDPSGNAATAVTRTVIVRDTIAPAVTAPLNVTANTGPGATSCGTTVSDATLGTASANDSCAGSLSVTRTGVPAGNVFPVGQTTITYSANDGYNTGTATQTVTVIDNTPPTITCPSNIVLEPTCPSGAIATYAVPVGDNCGVQGTLATTSPTAGLASGLVFPIGTTTVTTTVTDIYGNSSSCSFTVTVLTPQAVLQNLITSVSNSSLTGTQKNGLLAKLNAALDGINEGKTNVACNKLDDFINSVQNLVDHGDITPGQGTSWINSANHVGNTIGCTNNPCT